MSTSPHWSSVKEAGVIGGMKFMFRVYHLFGRLPFRICLFPVMWYFFLFRTAARKSSLQYLALMRRSGLVPSNGSPLWQSYRLFYNFGESLLDKLAAWKGDITNADITFHNYDLFSQLNETGTGAIIIGSHLGNLEISRALVSRKFPSRINVLMHTAHAEKFNRMLKKAGSGNQVNIIQVTDINPATAIMLQQKIADGEFLVIAGDRTPVSGGKHTSNVQFLGQTSPFPNGPYVMAAILKCPVLLMFCLRQEDSQRPHFDLYFESFAQQVLLPRKTRIKALEKYCQHYANRLASYCERAPLQWFNFHSFWNTDEVLPPHEGNTQ